MPARDAGVAVGVESPSLPNGPLLLPRPCPVCLQRPEATRSKQMGSTRVPGRGSEALSGAVDVLQGEHSLLLARGRGDSPKLSDEQQNILVKGRSKRKRVSMWVTVPKTGGQEKGNTGTGGTTASPRPHCHSGKKHRDVWLSAASSGTPGIRA